MFQVKYYKLLELHVKNIWQNLLERKLSTQECKYIHSMFLGSKKCFHVIELIVFSLESEVHLESHREHVLKSPLFRFFFLCVVRRTTIIMHKRLFVVLSFKFPSCQKIIVSWCQTLISFGGQSFANIWILASRIELLNTSCSAIRKVFRRFGKECRKYPKGRAKRSFWAFSRSLLAQANP